MFLGFFFWHSFGNKQRSKNCWVTRLWVQHYTVCWTASEKRDPMSRYRLCVYALCVYQGILFQIFVFACMCKCERSVVRPLYVSSWFSTVDCGRKRNSEWIPLLCKLCQVHVVKQQLDSVQTLLPPRGSAQTNIRTHTRSFYENGPEQPWERWNRLLVLVVCV